MHLTRQQVADRRRLAAVGHVHHAGAGHRLEQLAGKMSGAAVARRCHVDLAGIGLGVGDELDDGLRRK